MPQWKRARTFHDGERQVEGHGPVLPLGALVARGEDVVDVLGAVDRAARRRATATVQRVVVIVEITLHHHRHVRGTA